MQQPVPKVKLGEKITALQQIVSPFGKVCRLHMSAITTLAFLLQIV